MRSILLFVLALAGCHASGLPVMPDGFGATPDLLGSAVPDAGACNNRVPSVHRPSPEVCPSARGPGSTYESGGACSVDGDCTQGTNGRCFTTDCCAKTNYCSYDTCFSDSDCTGGAPCSCRASATASGANFCAEGSGCRTDGDCGPCGYCSPAGSDSACNSSFQCHTSSDLCVEDSDCKQAGSPYCRWDNAKQRFACLPGCPLPPLSL
jgi:hypothetical protein